MARQRKTDGAAVRITTAEVSREEDIAARQRRYLLSMSLRSACFVGAVVAALAGLTWLWPFLIACAIVLPYIAVVLANVATTRREGFELRGAPGSHPELPSGGGHRD
ncbi:DUF3099 domain-containing protein [Nocardioides sp. cx-169]|uniref:DUF3099 domain-containing protein n=1 Tax=Nocardioides sp. cx-169 TaxID=2899080 RepID=UPI001E64F503|nr:DUF3099 domain-containing protein [Nocardioides sp. cx-169]MCD4535241.1 DUF3099 domain-containing protein [Nocardioides sp. cx-169]